MSELLKLYVNNSKVMQALDLACEQEQELADGLQLSEDILLQGVIDQSNGFWQLSFIVAHGEVIFSALDYDFTQIRIVSVPAASMVLDHECLEFEQVEAIRYKHARVMDVDMRDVASLKAAKEYFADDYVMSNIPLADQKAGNVARMLIYYLRSYRKIYTDYYKSFAFLWQNTPYTSALALRRAIDLN